MIPRQIYLCSHMALEALLVRFFRGGVLKLLFSCLSSLLAFKLPVCRSLTFMFAPCMYGLLMYQY